MKLKIKELKNIIVEVWGDDTYGSYTTTYLLFKDETGKRGYASLDSTFFKNKKPRLEYSHAGFNAEPGFSAQLEAKIRKINFKKLLSTAWENSPEHLSLAKNKDAALTELIFMLETQLGPGIKISRISNKKADTLWHEFSRAKQGKKKLKRFKVYIEYERENNPAILTADNTGEIDILYAPPEPTNQYELDDWTMFADAFDSAAYELSNALDGAETYEQLEQEAGNLGYDVISAAEAKKRAAKFTKMFGKSGGYPNV